MDYNQGRALGEARAAAREEQLALDLSRQQLVELKGYAEQSRATRAGLAVCQQFITAGSQEETIITNLVQGAENNCLHLTEIRFEQHVRKQNYQEIPFHVTLVGDYWGLLELMQYLQNSPRAIRIDHIRVEQITPAAGQIKVEIAASAFYF